MRRRLEGMRLARSGALIASALSATACAEHIGRAELLEQIAAGAAPAIVDVRSAREYDEGHVPGAVHVPFYSLLSAGDRVPAARTEGEPVVLYCEHGPRAGIARAQLWLASGRPVRFLDGHMTAWRRDGLPLETPEGPARE